MDKIVEPVALYCRTSPSGATYKNNKEPTIEQQLNCGTKWINDNGITEHEIYIDEDISGSKVADFSLTDGELQDRPELNRLLTDIEKGLIKTVWVWENARWSRNNFLTARINQVLLKHKIIIVEDNHSYDSSNPEDIFVRSLMNAYSVYERYKIVARTQRGLLNAIDNGNRSFSRFFGYDATKTRDGQGYLISKPNYDDLALVKLAYGLYNEGKSLNDIVRSLNGNPNIDELKLRKLSTKWHRILNHEEYTGKVLTTEGLKIERSFLQGNPKAIFQLRDDKYWIPSRMYTEEIVTREVWIKTKIKLYQNKGSRGKYRLVDTLSTGIIKCQTCGDSYYYHETTSGNNGKSYPYYTHKNGPLRRKCTQSPKTITIKKIDSVLRFIYWLYWYNIADISKITHEAEQQKKVQYEVIEKEIKRFEKMNQKIKKAIQDLQEKMLELSDYQVEVFETISSYNKNLKANNDEISVQQKRLLEIKLNKEIGVETIKSKINEFDNPDIKVQRELLLTVIQTAIIYETKVLVCCTSNVFFYFDLSDKDLLKNISILADTESTSRHRKIQQECPQEADWLIAKHFHTEPVFIEGKDALPEPENQYTWREFTEMLLNSKGFDFHFPNEKSIFYSLNQRLTNTIFKMPMTN
jgi:DNA invertase Pin-like site-specific DNA recombinase